MQDISLARSIRARLPITCLTFLAAEFWGTSRCSLSSWICNSGVCLGTDQHRCDLSESMRGQRGLSAERVGSECILHPTFAQKKGGCGPPGTRTMANKERGMVRALVVRDDCYAGSSTTSMRNPKAFSARDFGCTKNTVVPREPGRGAASMMVNPLDFM